MRRRDEVLVGIFTLVALAALVAGTLWLARGGLSRGYPLYAQFDWGAGLKQGQSVLFSGVNVGYVDEVKLLDTGLVVTLRVYKSQRVPTGTVASIIPNGIFGDMQIALRAEQGPTGTYLDPGDTIPSARGATGLGDVIARVDSIGVNFNKLISAIHSEITDDKRLIGDLRKASRTADSMFATFSRVAAEQDRQLTRTQDALRHSASKLDSVPLDSAMRELREGVRSFNTLIMDVKSTSEKLRGLMAKVDSGPGTLSMLLNDEKLAADLRATLVKWNELLADFRLNPRKYIRVTIF